MTEKRVPMPLMVTVNCAHCGVPFQARKADVNRGWGKFHSKSCKASYQTARMSGKKLTPVQKAITKPKPKDEPVDSSFAEYDRICALEDRAGSQPIRKRTNYRYD